MPSSHLMHVQLYLFKMEEEDSVFISKATVASIVNNEIKTHQTKRVILESYLREMHSSMVQVLQVYSQCINSVLQDVRHLLPYLSDSDSDDEQPKTSPVNFNWINDSEFRCHFKMSKSTLESLIQRIKPNLRSIHYGANVKTDHVTMCLITIWYLANAESLKSIGDRFNISRGTVCTIAGKVCKLFSTIKQEFINWPTAQEMSKVTSAFHEVSQLTGVVGAIGSMHVPIKAPLVNSDEYKNSSLFYSIVLQAVCTADAKFTNCVCECPGSLTESDVFQRSPLWGAMNNNVSTVFPNETYCLVGGPCYSMSSHVMIPFEGESDALSQTQMDYNEKHALACMPIQNALQNLKTRWEKLQFIDANIKNIPAIVVAACCLHNFCIEEDDAFMNEDATVMQGAIGDNVAHPNV